LNKPGSPVRISLSLGKAIYLQQAAWKVCCQVMEEEHKRVERERRRQREQVSEAKLEPSIEASPVMSSVMYREAQGVKLHPLRTFSYGEVIPWQSRSLGTYGHRERWGA
jgi:hypothetical protein